MYLQRMPPAAEPGVHRVWGQHKAAERGQEEGHVAAAIGATVAENQAIARTGSNLTLKTKSNLGIKAETHTNYSTWPSGEAVSDDIGIGAAVAVTATRNNTGDAGFSGIKVGSEARDINVLAQPSRIATGVLPTPTWRCRPSGWSAARSGRRRGIGCCAQRSRTRASIDRRKNRTATTPVGNVNVQADETTHLAAQARAGGHASAGAGRSGRR